jgi:hypothetical protein
MRLGDGDKRVSPRRSQTVAVPPVGIAGLVLGGLGAQGLDGLCCAEFTQYGFFSALRCHHSQSVPSDPWK